MGGSLGEGVAEGERGCCCGGEELEGLAAGEVQGESFAGGCAAKRTIAVSVGRLKEAGGGGYGG